MLHQLLGQAEQHRIVRAQALEAADLGHLAVEPADHRPGAVFGRAVTAPPKIHEQRLVLEGLALLEPVLHRLLGLALGPLVDRLGLLGGFDLGREVRVLGELGLDLGLGLVDLNGQFVQFGDQGGALLVAGAPLRFPLRQFLVDRLDLRLVRIEQVQGTPLGGVEIADDPVAHHLVESQPRQLAVDSAFLALQPGQRVRGRAQQRARLFKIGLGLAQPVLDRTERA